ncbi:hypothetical protein Mapa_005215 [Marchantia paleacea]|nr:hypothetical protein Mapa_005215 [Marchantia paleacea]
MCPLLQSVYPALLLQLSRHSAFHPPQLEETAVRPTSLWTVSSPSSPSGARRSSGRQRRRIFEQQLSYAFRNLGDRTVGGLGSSHPDC